MIELHQKGIFLFKNEINLRPLQMLQKIQHHRIINNELNYQLDGYQCLSLLRQQWFIKNFSIGQVIIITYNIQKHLIKIYQKMNISQILIEKIYINNKLKVKFVNLHETEGQISYEKNQKEFIVQVRQIFLAFQESFNTKQKQINFQLKNYLAEKLYYIINDVIGILKSNKHHKNLEQFINKNITDQQLNHKLINDNIIDPLEFSQLFEIQQQSKVCNLNPDDDQDEKSVLTFSNQPSSQTSRVPSDSEVQNQLQFKQNLCEVRNYNQNIEDQNQEIVAILLHEDYDQKQLIESEIPEMQIQNDEKQQIQNNNQIDQKQSVIPNQFQQQSSISVPSQNSSENNDQNVQVESEILLIKISTQSKQSHQIQNNDQNDQKQSVIPNLFQQQSSISVPSQNSSENNDQNVQIKPKISKSVKKNVLFRSSENQNQDKEVQFKPQSQVPSKQSNSSDDNDQNEVSIISQFFNQDQNIQEINDESFKKKLKKHLIKKYPNVDEKRAQQLFQDSKKYYDIYQAYDNKLKNLIDQNQNKSVIQFQVSFQQNFFDLQKKLLDQDINVGIQLCQNQMDKWYQKHIQLEQFN